MAGGQAFAAADLNVSPKRVVLGADARAAAIYVFNRGDAPASYSIGLVDRAMTPDGQIRALNDPTLQKDAPNTAARLKSAQALLTYTPRRVTLAPGESQIVRLRVNRPTDLAPGEYHTHLTVTALPPEDSGLTAEQAAGPAATQVITKINTLFSISIAVIVRNGPADVQGGIDSMTYAVGPSTDPKTPGARQAVLSLDLVRKGASSLYGDVEVRPAKAPKSAPALGLVRGVGVYGEIDRRTVQVALAQIPKSGDRLDITFRDDDTKPGQALATATFIAP